MLATGSTRKVEAHAIKDRDAAHGPSTIAVRLHIANIKGYGVYRAIPIAGECDGAAYTLECEISQLPPQIGFVRIGEPTAPATK